MNGNGPDSDSDGDPLTTTLIDGAGFAEGVPFALASGAMLTANADSTFTYDPKGQFDALNSGDVDQDVFTYTIDDGNRGIDTATVTLTINGISLPADAHDDAYASTGNVGIHVSAANGVFADNGSGADRRDCWYRPAAVQQRLTRDRQQPADA